MYHELATWNSVNMYGHPSMTTSSQEGPLLRKKYKGRKKNAQVEAGQHVQSPLPLQNINCIRKTVRTKYGGTILIQGAHLPSENVHTSSFFFPQFPFSSLFYVSLVKLTSVMEFCITLQNDKVNRQAGATVMRWGIVQLWHTRNSHLKWSLTSSMTTIDLCCARALFGVFFGDKS